MRERLALTSPPGHARSPEDGLWLAASHTPYAGARILDAACGNGIVGLALLTRLNLETGSPSCHVTGIDQDRELTTCASHNAALNQLGSHYTAQTSNLLTLPPPGGGLFTDAFCNPPFHATAYGHTAATRELRNAKSLHPHELTRWLEALDRLTTSNATLALILHTACHDELTAFTGTLSASVTLTPLQTSATRPPKRLLALIRKGQPHTLTITPPLPAFNPTLRDNVLTHAKSIKAGLTGLDVCQQ